MCVWFLLIIMDQCIGSNRNRVKIIGDIGKEKRFQYMHWKIGKDSDFDVLFLNIEFEGWLPARVQLWPTNKNAKKVYKRNNYFQICVIVIKVWSQIFTQTYEKI